jgi:K+-transporting ATPase ATPase C chain
MKIIGQSLRMFLILTIVTGIIYPIIVTVLGQLIFPEQANGSLVSRGKAVIGSSLIGQKFADNKYFSPRPSAVDYNPLPSGGSNQGMTSALLDSVVRERRVNLMELNPEGGTIPSDLLFASGSGLDPHISPEAAYFQVNKVAAARGLDNEQKTSLTNIVHNYVEHRTYGILGQPRVNVLALNLAVDSAFHDNQP